MNYFDKVYPFTTEAINSYFPLLDLENKKLLTLGSSMDQVFNAILLGAKEITVYDINPYILDFYKIKKNALTSVDRNHFFHNVEATYDIPFTRDCYDKDTVYGINNYLNSDNNYNELINKLDDVSVDIINGDIYNIDLNANKKYDRVVLSNVLDYAYIYKDKSRKHLIAELMYNLDKNLESDAIVQLLYLYNFNINNETQIEKLQEVKDVLSKYKLDLETFRGVGGNKDAVVLCKKK